MRFTATALRATLAAAALLFAAAAGAQTAYLGGPTGPQPRLKTTTIKAGMHLITAELAVTEEQQQTGMMFRKTMGPNEGMLFVAPDAGVRCFWMHNTLLPLAIAFVADDGRVVNVDEMKPQSDDTHCSKEPVRFALEMNQGWFAKHGIAAGSKLRGAPFGN